MPVLNHFKEKFPVKIHPLPRCFLSKAVIRGQQDDDWADDSGTLLVVVSSAFIGQLPKNSRLKLINYLDIK